MPADPAPVRSTMAPWNKWVPQTVRVIVGVGRDLKEGGS